MKNLKTVALSVLMSPFIFTSCEKKVVVQNPNENMATTSTTEVTTPSAAPSKATQNIPPKIKTFLEENYPGIAISKFEITTRLSKTQYEVKLNNGVDVEFDKDANLTEIKDYNGVPKVLIPAKINEYVDKNYKDIKIKSLDKESDKNKIKVELLTDVDLEFDQEGNFLRLNL